MAKKALVVKEKNKGGRPKSVIDEKALVEMASIDCTIDEICSILGCHHDTLYSRYSALLKKGRDQGNHSLKMRLFQKAMEGDMSALIWLSKNRFGYRDKPLEEMTQINFNVFVNEVPK